MNYSKTDLLTYLMVYAASADFDISEEEVTMIKSKVGATEYEKMERLFEDHNDIQSINFISDTVHALGLGKSDIDGLMEEVKQVFLADGQFDMLERQLEMRLNHILRDL